MGYDIEVKVRYSDIQGAQLHHLNITGAEMLLRSYCMDKPDLKEQFKLKIQI